MLTGLNALVLGLVEGFTEFLPISSTAHLVLTSHLLGVLQSNFAKTFEIAIQSGAILAVVVLYWKRFLEIKTLKKLVVAFLPTGVIGLLLYKVAKAYLLDNIGIILLALGAGGVLMILFEYLYERKVKKGGRLPEDGGLESVTYKKAFWIGIFQSLAIVPGVSRAAATVIGGMLVGIRRETIVEFSFLLAVPTMLAATGLDLLKNLHAFSASEMDTLLIGLLASFVMAIVSIKFLLRYIKGHTFTGFGVYRILLAAAFLLVLAF